MRKIQSLPSYHVTVYEYSHSKGNYIKGREQPEKTPLLRLPYDLVVEYTQTSRIKCNALYLIRAKGKTSNNNEFFTGLQDTKHNQWFSGDDYEYKDGQKVKSTVLFHFNSDRSKLKVYYFEGFYIDKTRVRNKFINDAIPQIIQINLQA